MIKSSVTLLLSVLLVIGLGQQGALARHKDHEGLEKCHHVMWLGLGTKKYDLNFLNLMIHHHECAMAMSQDALAKAQHPELKDFAQKTIDRSGPEIEQMQTWRKEWYNQ